MNNTHKNNDVASFSKLVTMLLIMWFFVASQMAQAAIPSNNLGPFANPGPVVQRIESDGNSDSIEMFDLLQGQSGYIWIGTDKGLIRFDGVQMKTFRHDPNDDNSLSDNNIRGLAEDQNGILWITTYGGGLNRFDKSTFEFTHYRHNPDDPTSISSDHLFAIAKSHDNKLWVGGFPGATLFSPLSGIGERKNSKMQPLTDNDKQRFRVLFEDSKQQLWYSVTGSGLFRFNRKTNQISQFTHDSEDPNSISADKVNKVYETQNGDIWIATSQGMNRYEGATDTFSRFALPLKAQNHIKALNIVAIYEDTQQRLWVGTLFNGLSLFDAEQQRFVEINNNANASDALESMSVTAILQDKSGVLWLTTLGQGLIKISSDALKFNGLTGKSQSQLMIGALTKTSDQKLWISANNNLYQLDEQSLETRLRAESKGHINRIIEGPDNTLLLSIFRQGIFSFDPNQESSSGLIPLPALPNNNIFTIAMDSAGTLWVGLFRSSKEKVTGLFSLAKGEKHFTHHIKSDVPTAILPLDDGRVLVGFRYQGLKIYDPLNGQLTPVTHLSRKVISVWHLFKDSNNRIWFSTQDAGLGQFDPVQNKITFVTELDELVGKTVFIMTQDEYGHLWFGSKVGLVRFNPDSDDDKQRVKVFNYQDGLPKIQFNTSKIITTPKGRVMVADNNRLVQFAPADLNVPTTEQNPFNTLITGFKILNQTIEPDKSDANNPLSVSIDQTQQLKLSYQDYLFSFSFASTNYNQSAKLRYAYKMEGLDTQWIEKQPHDLRATFTSLPPKTYEFKVKTSNEDGSWNDNYRSLKITITPPWWQTNLAYAVYLLSTLLLIFGIHRFKTAQLLKRADALERGVKDRTKTIDGLLAQKEHLFANISHEFRTPLTLILSPIERLMSRPELQSASSEFSLVQRSANRLLQMVDQLLEFSKLDNDNSVELEPVSLEQTLNIIKASFEPLLQSKNHQLIVNPFDDVIVAQIPDSLNKILINIVTNAHKYTPQNGQITITVSNQSQQVKIAISDTGIGIDEKHHQAVFERFSRITEQHSDFNPGAGIGLALVKELVHANCGAIELNSQVGQGATFTLTLPISSNPAITSNPKMLEAINNQLNFTVEQSTPNELITSELIINEPQPLDADNKKVDIDY